MVTKRTYAIVGANPIEHDRKYPRVMIESPLEGHVELSPRPAMSRRRSKRWWGTALDGTGAGSEVMAAGRGRFRPEFGPFTTPDETFAQVMDGDASLPPQRRLVIALAVADCRELTEVAAVWVDIRHSRSPSTWETTFAGTHR